MRLSICCFTQNELKHSNKLAQDHIFSNLSEHKKKANKQKTGPVLHGTAVNTSLIMNYIPPS